jgi:broad specificity phosphatase PhoE
MTLSQDDSQWPIVVDTMIGEPTDEDIRGYNARRAERLARAQRHAQVMDGRAGARMSARHRQMIADFDEEHRDAQRRYLAGVALVVSSAFLRVLLNVIYRVTPSVCPRRPSRSIEEATSWARGLLRNSPP